MKTLRVSLADLEGQPHGSHHANTNVTVTARYTGPVTLADGRIVPAAIKTKQLSTGTTGFVDFEVYASDDPLVHADWRDFAIVVTATITHARSGKQLAQVARTVKVLSSHTSPVALGTLEPAEGLPRGWVTVAEMQAALDAQTAAAQQAATDAQEAIAAAEQAVDDADAAILLAQQAQAAVLEIPDANVAALVNNPTTNTRQTLDVYYIETGEALVAVDTDGTPYVGASETDLAAAVPVSIDDDGTPVVLTGGLPRDMPLPDMVPSLTAAPAEVVTWSTTGDFTSTGLPLQPRSVGVDGWVYGSYNNTQVWRSGDGLVTRQISAHQWTGKQVLWIGRTREGYCALIINAPAPSQGQTGELWFSTNWSTGWTKTADTGPLRTLSPPRPRKGPDGGTILLVCEYDNHIGNVVALNLWLSRDGGQTWNVIRQTTPNSQDYNAHWHNADYDEKRQRIWAVSGDGTNSFTGYSDDFGETWWPSPFPVGHPLRSTIENAPHNKSTMLLVMGDSVHMCPDHDHWTTGIWTMDSDLGTPSTQIRYEVPGAPSGALHWVVGSVVALRGGREAYVAAAPNGSTDPTTYILGTGDYGRTWHLVSQINLGTGSGNSGIVGVDHLGYLYFRGINTSDFGSNIARTRAPRWTYSN